MDRHLDKVLAHAERQLISTREKRPTDLLPIYKRFLKIEEYRLRLQHQGGAGGRDVCRRRAEVMDVLLQHVFATATAFSEDQLSPVVVPLALIALGGYGRGELNPFSDVDVMFLHSESDRDVSAYVAQVVEQILYLLWDIGFKVGHSTRSIDEAIAQAHADMLTKTAMLESRYLAGDRELERSFRERFRASCVDGYEKDYIAHRLRDQAARHAKFGNTIYVQEPHLKSGCGGLRDYQNLLWMTLFKEGALTTTQLVGKDWLSASDARRIDAAYDFLLRVRTDLHYATGRGTDVLHLTLQAEIAKRLGYTQKTPVHRSEAFMKDYYENARDVFRITERVTEQFATSDSARSAGGEFGFLPRPDTQRQYLYGFYIEDGQLYAESRDLFTKDPEQMLRAFQHAQEHRLGLSPALADLFTRCVSLVTRTYEYAKGPREIFKAILSRKGEVGRVLRLMHQVDFLGRYIPEFAPLTCLVQHEFFHRYTADEHTLVCIEKLDELMQTDNPRLIAYRDLFERLTDPLVLYLALLLHDTGKGVAARPHSEASAFFAHRVAMRLQLTSDQRKALVLLVDHHVTLSNIAQQRNLDDPATVVEFAAVVKNQWNLDALMLLTLADGQGTSAEGWSDWKESLVWQLYHSTSRYLRNQEEFYNHTKIEREKLYQAVRERLPDDFTEELDAHFDFSADNYFRAFGVDEIVSHLRLIRSFFERLHAGESPLSPVMEWKPFPDAGHTIASLCTWDRQQLLAKVAGSFAVVPLNILSADVFTRGDNIVLNVFHVCSTKSEAVRDARDTAVVESTLQKALEDADLDFGPLLQKAQANKASRLTKDAEFPTRIAVDNRAHPVYTLVQIQTPDRVGLLYDLVSCLGRENLYIALSRISTQQGAAIDTFYVTDAETRSKVTDVDRLTTLQTAIHRAAVGLAEGEVANRAS
jgi:[protein-PII] uridylyltransferase